MFEGSIDGSDIKKLKIEIENLETQNMMLSK